MEVCQADCDIEMAGSELSCVNCDDSLYITSIELTFVACSFGLVAMLWE